MNHAPIFVGSAAHFQLHDHDARCVSVRTCCPQDCKAFPGKTYASGEFYMLGTTQIRHCSDRI